MVFDSEKINPDWEVKGKGGPVIVRNHDLNALASAENRESKNEARMLHSQIP